MIEGIAMVALATLGIGILLCFWRVLVGPSLFDRVLAFDCIALHFVGGTLLLSVLFGSAAFMDVVLVVALLGFIGTTSLAAYLEGSLVD